MKSMPETVLAGSGKDMALGVGSQRAGIEMLKDGMGKHNDKDDARAELEEQSGLVECYREVVVRCRQPVVGVELTAS